MPRIINTFLDTYDLFGKSVLPFCTSDSSGVTQSVADIKAAEPEAAVKDGIRASGKSNDDLARWLRDGGVSVQ